jgi:hypothetical protein
MGRRIAMYFAWDRTAETTALGRLVVCDATLWSGTAGGLRGLQVLWKNVIEA